MHQASSAAPAIDEVVVEPEITVRRLAPSFFGINYVAFWDQAQGSAASARALAQTAIRNVRFPGGAPADWYDWQDPYYKSWSSTSPLKLWHWARSFGANHLVFGTDFQAHLPNPPGRTYSANSAQNAAAWVRYVLGAGIDADMEVGNEEDLTTLHVNDDPAYDPYIRAFNAQADAMHRANPRVRVLGPVGTNEWYWWALDGLAMFLKGTGDRVGTGAVDGVSLHFYKGNNWDNARSVAQYWLSSTGPWAAIRSAIRHGDTRSLPVYITEWNLGGSQSHDAFVPTVGHALAVADMIGAFALSGVAGEDYFDLHAGQSWGLLYGKNESRRLDSPTPTYYAMALWRNMGTRVVPLRQTADPSTSLSAYATSRSDGSVQLLLINKQPTPQTIHVAVKGTTFAGRRLRVFSLQAATGVDGLEARYDGVLMPSPQSGLPGPRDLGTVHGKTVSYVAPAYSANVLDLSRAP
jgi:hypothetical protein